MRRLQHHDVAVRPDTILQLTVEARDQLDEITFYSAPITRCREEIRAGAADAFPTAPYPPPRAVTRSAWPCRTTGLLRKESAP